MLLGARTLALNSHSAPAPRLPYDYEVEYLQSDGVAYIDTGVVIGGVSINDSRFDLSIVGTALLSTITSTSAYSAPIAFTDYSLSSRMNANIGLNAYLDGTGNYYAIFRSASGNPISTKTVKTIKLGTFAEFSMNDADGTIIAKLNGDVIGSTTTNRSGIMHANMTAHIFAISHGSSSLNVTCSPYNFFVVREFKFKNLLTDQVVDMIAVSKDGVGYMYDKISGQLFGNAASSGAFIVGDRIS